MRLGKKIWLPRRVTICSPTRTSAPQAHSCKITQSTSIATQMQLKGFFWQEITWPPRLLKRKNNKVESFLTLFFMSTLTWITEKELEQVL